MNSIDSRLLFFTSKTRKNTVLILNTFTFSMNFSIISILIPGSPCVDVISLKTQLQCKYDFAVAPYSAVMTYYAKRKSDVNTCYGQQIMICVCVAGVQRCRYRAVGGLGPARVPVARRGPAVRAAAGRGRASAQAGRRLFLARRRCAAWW